VRLFYRTVFILLAAAQFLALVSAFEKPAYAYADPGSGLLFLQVAGSMLAGGLFVVRSKLRKLFRFGRGAEEKRAAEPGHEARQ
jgi:hypothetical protein